MITGSGTVITESRQVDSFDRLVVEGSGQVFVEIGPAPSLEVQAEDNVIPVLTTEINNGRLILSIEPDTSLRDIEPIVYRITAPDLVGIDIAGSGDVMADGIETTEFEVSIAGSGDVEPVGVAEHLSLSTAGSGTYRGIGLVAQSAKVDIAGSGSAMVNATVTLEISVAGSGSVEYVGNPTVTQSIAGSGRVLQR